MASWGALSGLGAGLQQFGNEWSDRAKAKLAEDLQRQREERREALDAAKEERRRQDALKQIDRYQTTTDIDPATGQMTRQFRNSNGDLLRTEAVSQLEQDSIRRQAEAEEAKLRTQGLEATLTQLQVDRTPQKWAQEDAMHNQRLRSESALQAQRYASAAASNRRGLEETTAPRNSASDARVLMDTYSDLVNEYTKAPKDGSPALTRAQAEDVAQATIQRAVLNELNPGQVAQAFRQALRITAERNKNNTSNTPQRRGGTLLGN